MSNKIINLDEEAGTILMVEHRGNPVVLSRSQLLELLDRDAWVRAQLQGAGRPVVEDAVVTAAPAKPTTRYLQRITLVVREAFDSFSERGSIEESIAGRLIKMLDQYDGQRPERPQSQLGYMLEGLLTLKGNHKRLHGRVREFLAAYPWLTDESKITRRFRASDLVSSKSNRDKKVPKAT